MAIDAVDWAMFSYFVSFIVSIELGEDNPLFYFLGGIIGIFAGLYLFTITSEAALTFLIISLSLLLILRGATRRYGNETD